MNSISHPNLAKTIGPYIQRPYQRIRIPGAEVWSNRPMNHWHMQLPPGITNIGVDCPDGGCKLKFHIFREWSYNDPRSLALTMKLKKGMKILLLLTYCGKDHVSFFTFDYMNDDPNYLRFHSQELSATCHFFQATQDKNNSYPIQIQWASLKYIAIVQSDAEAFGKYGGKKCFMRELARLTGHNLGAIRRSIEKLDKLHPMPRLPPLKIFNHGEIYYRAIMAGETDLSNLNNNQRTANELAYLILCLTRQGELTSFAKKLIPLLPNNKSSLKTGLETALRWYSYHLSPLERTTASWWKQWCLIFNLPKDP